MRISAQAVEGFARTIASAGFLERDLAERTTLQMERLRAERHERRRPALFRGELLRMRWSFGDPDAMLTRTHARTFAGCSRAGSCSRRSALFVVYLGAARRAMGRVQGARSQSTYSLHNITLRERRRALGHGRRRHPHPRARPRLRVQVFRRRGARARIHARSTSSRRSTATCRTRGAFPSAARGSGSPPPADGSSSSSPASPRSCGGPPRPDTLVAERRGGGDARRRRDHAAHQREPAPSARRLLRASPIGWRSRISACAPSPTSTGGCSGTLFRLDVPEPAATPRERRVFLIYGAIATVYTTLLLGFVVVLVVGWSRKAFGIAGGVVTAIVLAFLLRRRVIGWFRGIVARRARPPRGAAADAPAGAHRGRGRRAPACSSCRGR